MIGYIETINDLARGDRDYELWLLFTQARYAVYRNLEKELLRYNITPEQARIISILHHIKEGITPTALSRILLLKPHTISALVNRMKKKGLVEKINDLDRKNLVRVILTEKGREAHKYTSNMKPIHQVMKILNTEQRNQFSKSLKMILTKAGDELGIHGDYLPPFD
jgi:MarR family transcriptional regulator, multiple antibiotic resistance protein MarR